MRIVVLYGMTIRFLFCPIFVYLHRLIVLIARINFEKMYNMYNNSPLSAVIDAE